MIVATAGHVDHGKTTLIKALTGIDTTHLPEERRRGMTIDLGFAALALPGGGFVGFVDVPGHERFVRNMLAGATGIDMALLTVAADDGIMPQTREHLEILDLLDVPAAMAVITKTDRASPQRIDEVAASIEELLRGTELAGAPVFRVAAVDGSGIAAVRDHIVACAASVRRPRHGALFRMPIDRGFVVEGAGLVLTGTIAAGRVTTGDRLVLMPSQQPVRVRKLHTHRQAVETCGAGERCALNIIAPEVDRASAGRGDWIVAAPIATASDHLDVRLTPAAGVSFGRSVSVLFCHGAGSTAGRVVPLQSDVQLDGQHLLARIVLDTPVHALARDVFILRDSSARRTLAGGLVVDPFAPTRSQRRKDRLAMVAALDQPDPALALAETLKLAGEIDLERFATAWNLSPEDAEALWTKASLVRRDNRGFDGARWAGLRTSMLASVEAWHRQHPDSPGPAAADLLSQHAALGGRELRTAVLDTLIREKELMRAGANVRRPTHDADFSNAERTIWRRIAPLLGPDHRPMAMHDIATSEKLDPKAVEKVLERAARAGYVSRIAPGRYLHRAAVADLAKLAETLAGEASDGLFDAARYRDRSALGRNLTIELLEHFDRIGLTRRVGDRRKVLKPAAALFGDIRA